MQDAARDAMARRHLRAAVEDLRPLLAKIDAAIGGFDDRLIVEVGSDWAGSTLRAVDRLYAPKELIGLNPGFASRELPPRISLRGVPAEHSGLPDGSVDGVFSSSAFEHIPDIPAVLQEMHRILKPGGLLYSHFGPLWSTSYGHHLWVQDGARVLTYHDVLLPPWCHLLSDEATVRDLLHREHGADLAERMARFVFRSDEQNQLHFDDHVRLVEESPFEVVFLKGYDAANLAAKYPTSQSPRLLDELAERFPGRTGWLYDGITMLLRKR